MQVPYTCTDQVFYTNKELETALQHAQIENMSMQQSVSKLTIELSSLLSRTENITMSWQRKIQQAMEKTKVAKQSNEVLQREIDNVRNENQTLFVRLQACNQVALETQAEKKRLQEDLQATQTCSRALDTLQKKYDSLETNHRHLQERYRICQQQNIAWQRTTNDSDMPPHPQAINQAQEDKNRQYQAKITELENRLAEYQVHVQDLQSQIKQYQFIVKEPGNYNAELQEFWPEQTFDQGHPLFCTAK